MPVGMGSRAARAFGGWMASTLGNAAATPIAYWAARAAWRVSPDLVIGEKELTKQWLTNEINSEEYYHDMLGYGVTMTSMSPWHVQPYDIVDGKLASTRSVVAAGMNNWGRAFRATFNNLDTATLLEMYQRGEIEPGTLNEMLSKNGITNRSVVTALKKLTEGIPGPSDLINFAVREAFNPELLTKFGYMNEYPYQLDRWLKKHGMNYPIGMPKPAGVHDDGSVDPVRDATWGDLYWWSHWELPSLSSGYEMFHRLYSTSRFGASPDYREGIGFERADLESLQKAQDIPTYWRRRLQAISYLPLTRTDVRRMHQIGVLDDSGVYHAYRAIGYDDTNANNLLQFTKQLTAKANQRGKLKVAADWLCKVYSAGLMTDDELTTLYVKTGLPIEEFPAWVTKCQISSRYSKAQDSIKAIKRGYMGGIFNEDAVRSSLISIGVIPRAVATYLTRWNLQRIYGTKEMSAGKAIDMFKVGLINEDDLTARLQNLNYRPVDVTLMITRAKQDIRAKKVKHLRNLLNRRERERARISRSITLTLNEIRTADEKRMRKILAASTESNLRKWYKKGLLSVEEIRTRLLAKGWQESDVQRWLVANLNIETIGVPNASEEEES